MLKFIILGLLLVFGFSNERVTIQLNWKYQFEFAGSIAAKEKGFYKDVGLDVELREYKHGMDIIDEVLKRKATYGIYNSNTLIEYLKGKPIKLLASFFSIPSPSSNRI